ncbi:MAG: hypothetical protein ACKO9I_22175 [Sphaerospermopsis kisseleviana]
MDFTWVKCKDCKVLLQDSTLVQPDNSQKPAKKTVIFAAKFSGLAVAAVVVVQILLFIARIVVIAALAFLFINYF